MGESGCEDVSQSGWFSLLGPDHASFWPARADTSRPDVFHQRSPPIWLFQGKQPMSRPQQPQQAGKSGKAWSTGELMGPLCSTPQHLRQALQSRRSPRSRDTSRSMWRRNTRERRISWSARHRRTRRSRF